MSLFCSLEILAEDAGEFECTFLSLHGPMQGVLLSPSLCQTISLAIRADTFCQAHCGSTFDAQMAFDLFPETFQNRTKNTIPDNVLPAESPTTLKQKAFSSITTLVIPSCRLYL